MLTEPFKMEQHTEKRAEIKKKEGIKKEERRKDQTIQELWDNEK